MRVEAVSPQQCQKKRAPAGAGKAAAAVHTGPLRLTDSLVLADVELKQLGIGSRARSLPGLPDSESGLAFRIRLLHTQPLSRSCPLTLLVEGLAHLPTPPSPGREQ